MSTAKTSTRGPKALFHPLNIAPPPPAWGKQNSFTFSPALGQGREFLFDRLDRVADLLVGVAAGDEEPKPRFVFRHSGVEDRVDVDAAPKQRVG